MRYQINGPQVNPKKQPTLWVIDNFYDNPDAIREFALIQNYEFSDYHRGRRTDHQFEIPGTKEAFESIMGMKITAWMETHGMCGRFQYCTCEDALVYHADSQKWAGVVYLTPDAPYESGTSLLAHKKTGIRHCDHPDIMNVWAEAAPTGVHLDATPWEEIDKIANVYNRLVIWDGHCPHAASKYFGFTKETSRLFHLFFFDTE